MNSVRLSSNSQPPFAMFRFSFEWQSKTNEKDDNLMTKMIYTKNYTIRVSKLRLHDVFRIRLQTKKIKHHYSFGSNLSDFFPSKFSFFLFRRNPKKIQASSFVVLHRQRAFQAKIWWIKNICDVQTWQVNALPFYEWWCHCKVFAVGWSSQTIKCACFFTYTLRTSEKQHGVAKSFQKCTSRKQVATIAFSGQQTDMCTRGTHYTRSDNVIVNFYLLKNAKIYILAG